MSGKALTSVVFAAALLAACHGSASGFVGAYDNARYNEESGDLRGFRVWVRDQPDLAVSLRECADDCDTGAWLPASSEGDALTFSDIEQRPAPNGTITEVRVRYRLTKEGTALVLTSPDTPQLREVLPPAKPVLRR